MNSSRVIYLHGFASSPASKKAQIFGERFRRSGVDVRTPDLNDGDFEHLALTRQLAIVEREAESGPVCLMGSSMGGYLAALYAARHPEVERVILLAPAFGFLRRFLETIGPEKAAEWERTGWYYEYNYATGKEERLWWGLIEDARQYEEFPGVKQPVLIVHGTHDTTVPYSLSEEFQQRHPSTRLDLVDSDHELTSAVEHIWAATREFFGLPTVDR